MENGILQRKISPKLSRNIKRCDAMSAILNAGPTVVVIRQLLCAATASPTTSQRCDGTFPVGTN